MEKFPIPDYKVTEGRGSIVQYTWLSNCGVTVIRTANTTRTIFDSHLEEVQEELEYDIQTQELDLPKAEFLFIRLAEIKKERAMRLIGASKRKGSVSDEFKRVFKG